MNEIDKILADVKTEGTDPFADLGGDTSTESLPENEIEKPAEGEIPAEDDKIPFHKHPRWIERENELRSLREREEEMARELEELKSFREETYKKTENTSIPDWFTELYGENEVAWRKYIEHENARTAEIEARILARQEEERMRETQEEQKWSAWIDNEISQLEAEGKKFDRNKLNQIMLDYSPTDANNNLDYRKGYAIYELLEGKKDTVRSDARKQLADTTTATTSKGEAEVKDYMTPAQLRNRPMTSLY